MSRMITAILRIPDEMYWDERPVYRAQHNANRFAAADEIERLQAELEETRTRAAREYAEMSKLLATFERDAMRYQWLRNSKPRRGYASVMEGDSRYTGTDLDELIDQELEHEK